MLDLIIIGGGPAALSAASYALGKQLDVRVICIERGGKTGAHQRLVGQIGEENLAGKTAAVIGATDRAFRGVAELAETAAQVYLIAPDPALLRGSIFHTVQRC